MLVMEERRTPPWGLIPYRMLCEGHLSCWIVIITSLKNKSSGLIVSKLTIYLNSFLCWVCSFFMDFHKIISWWTPIHVRAAFLGDPQTPQITWWALHLQCTPFLHWWPCNATHAINNPYQPHGEWGRTPADWRMRCFAQVKVCWIAYWREWPQCHGDWV